MNAADREALRVALQSVAWLDLDGTKEGGEWALWLSDAMQSDAFRLTIDAITARPAPPP